MKIGRGETLECPSPSYIGQTPSKQPETQEKTEKHVYLRGPPSGGPPFGARVCVCKGP